jgi:cell division protein FtsB
MRKKRSELIIRPYRKKKKSRFRYILMGLFLFCFVISLSLYLWISWIVKKESVDVEKIKKENSYLRREIQKYLSSDKYYEEILRTRYGFIKDGEKIFVYSEPLLKKTRKELAGGKAL